MATLDLLKELLTKSWRKSSMFGHLVFEGLELPEDYYSIFSHTVEVLPMVGTSKNLTMLERKE